ncbi:GTP pyrophosphokinase family protein [Streptomyces rubiginosohelvolus]|uniref:GTP pyrophosphokinase n=1 Tax=Streptomyces rubiginosohelvolus TaxID=67362 RepID=UPI00366256EE
MTLEGNIASVEQNGDSEFDLDGHISRAQSEYSDMHALYEDFSYTVESILKTCLSNGGIYTHSITSRAKSIESFSKKAGRQSREAPGTPKYLDPIRQITDLAGVRVVTYFLSTIPEVEKVVHSEFEVRERIDKSKSFEKEQRLGYQSFHYLVALKENRRSLPEYAKFSGLLAEVQVRTILQHAWAEIEHDIQYKATYALPIEIKRRFMALAGLIEIADREFQAIEEKDRELIAAARKSVAKGDLNGVEITPDALQAYLDQRYGADGRMSSYSYKWMVELLEAEGFRSLGQVDQVVSGYDDDKVSKAAYGSRQGQLNRFELVLLAALGEKFIERHLYNRGSEDDWYPPSARIALEKFKAVGISVGDRSLPD